MRSWIGDGDVRVVIFRESGDKAFSAGGDAMEFLSTEPKELIDWGRTIERTGIWRVQQ